MACPLDTKRPGEKNIVVFTTKDLLNLDLMTEEEIIALSDDDRMAFNRLFCLDEWWASTLAFCVETFREGREGSDQRHLRAVENEDVSA